MIKLIDTKYMYDQWTVGSYHALNGLCKDGRVFMSSYTSGISTSSYCILGNHDEQLPECIECLTSRMEGLYARANRL